MTTKYPIGSAWRLPPGRPRRHAQPDGLEAMLPTGTKITKWDNTYWTVCFDDREFEGNSLSEAVRTALAKMEQGNG